MKVAIEIFTQIPSLEVEMIHEKEKKERRTDLETDKEESNRMWKIDERTLLTLSSISFRLFIVQQLRSSGAELSDDE